MYTFYNVSIVDKEARKIPTLRGSAFTSGDYAQGLRILARLVTRRHMRRMNKRLESKNGIPKDE